MLVNLQLPVLEGCGVPWLAEVARFWGANSSHQGQFQVAVEGPLRADLGRHVPFLDLT